jgi:predicted dehydrogenase
MVGKGHIGVGIVGYGYWGPNMVRNFHAARRATVSGICEIDRNKLAKAEAAWPGISLYSNFEDLLKDKSVDAVCLATPVSSHFYQAMLAIDAGKHLLISKPLVVSTDEALRLKDAAAARNLTLMVDHTFVYTSAVKKIKDMVGSGDLGKLYYYDGVRVNLGLFQHDVNVLWDLAIHDLSILDFLVGREPEAVSATGVSHIPGQPENVAYMTLFFDDDFIAHLHANWLAPVKVRRTLIGGSKKMVVYDDLQPSEKIKVYDKGVDYAKSTQEIHEMLINYRVGDVWIPKLDLTEALALEIEHFLDCVEHSRLPLTSVETGIRTVRTLEAASQSMKEFGRPVHLTP